jgi:hypothetical protein
VQRQVAAGSLRRPLRLCLRLHLRLVHLRRLLRRLRLLRLHLQCLCLLHLGKLLHVDHRRAEVENALLPAQFGRRLDSQNIDCACHCHDCSCSCCRHGCSCCCWQW